MEARDVWWSFLDALEARRRVYLMGAALFALLAVCVFAVPVLLHRSSSSRQADIIYKWIDMGRLDLAAEEVSRAIEKPTADSTIWTAAAVLARAVGDSRAVLHASGRAATLSPENSALAIDWATEALLAGRADLAARILAAQPPAVVANSAPALRVRGELARQSGDQAAARRHFAAALRIAGPNAQDETNLGRLLLLSSDPAEQARARLRLAPLASDPAHGAVAVRALLADALQRQAPPVELAGLAEALVAHPRCVVSDLATVLRILAAHDPAAYRRHLDRLETQFATHPDRALLLVDCLNTIGRPGDALAWAATLPPDFAQTPALAVALAEARRLTSDWEELDRQTAEGDWGTDYEFLRLAYALESARRRDDESRRQELWRSLQARIAGNGVRAAYAAGALYLWGQVPEALALAEAAAEDPFGADSALGLILRHHQLQRDAAGQYRAFRRLHLRHPDDADIRNNLAYFSALTGQNLHLARRLAEANVAAAPDEVRPLATLAFVLVQSGQADTALDLLRPHVGGASLPPELALPYGLALVRSRRGAEAIPMLRPLLDQTTTDEETRLIQGALEQAGADL